MLRRAGVSIWGEKGITMAPACDRPRHLKLTAGWELLENWSASATQAERNIVYEVLLATVERTLFTKYVVLEDVERIMEFFVLARGDLIVKIRVHGLHSFRILYAGSACAAPGLDRAVPEQAASALSSISRFFNCLLYH